MKTLTNVMMDHIHAQLMLHVPTQLVLTHAPALLATLEMVKTALTLMNVQMNLFHVQLMLHVLI